MNGVAGNSPALQPPSMGVLRESSGPSIILYDTFTGSNGVLSAHSPDVGTSNLYASVPSGATISSNTLSLASVTPTLFDLAVSDFTMFFNINTPGNSGLLFRGSNTSNFWMCQAVSGVPNNMLFRKRVSGADLTQYTLTPVGVNDLIKVVCLGNTLTLYQNGVQKYTTTDAFNQIAKSFGVAGFGSASQQFGNWLVTVP